MKNIFFLQFTGKRGRAHSDRSYSSEHESAEQGHGVGDFSGNSITYFYFENFQISKFYISSGPPKIFQNTY